MYVLKGFGQELVCPFKERGTSGSSIAEGVDCDTFGVAMHDVSFNRDVASRRFLRAVITVRCHDKSNFKQRKLVTAKLVETLVYFNLFY